MEALRRVRETGTSAEVVVLTGHPDVTTAIEAMKLGAYDYLTKPFKLAEVELVLRRAAERRRITQENTALRRMVSQRRVATACLGQSPAMAAVLATVERIAAPDANVLIEGESGTGKGLVAQTIHQQSPRAQGPFLAINCSGFQDQLLESELFGHEKGAFTGAVALKQGLFEVADRGTLFLDEVAEMTPAMQAKLLQVLDSREFRRVGGTRLHRADVRIVAATNKRMQQRGGRGPVSRGSLLSAERGRHPRASAAGAARGHPDPGRAFPGPDLRPARRPRKTLSPEALRLLGEYSWPGNVRELSNIMERLVILAPGDVIEPDALPPTMLPPASPCPPLRRAPSRCRRWSGRTSRGSCRIPAERRCRRPASWDRHQDAQQEATRLRDLPSAERTVVSRGPETSEAPSPGTGLPGRRLGNRAVVWVPRPCVSGVPGRTIGLNASARRPATRGTACLAPASDRGRRGIGSGDRVCPSLRTTAPAVSFHLDPIPPSRSVPSYGAFP